MPLKVLSTASRYEALPPSAVAILGDYEEDGTNHGRTVYRRLNTRRGTVRQAQVSHEGPRTANPPSPDDGFWGLLWEAHFKVKKILPSSQKQLQAKINKSPGILDFLSIALRKRKRKKISGILIFFRKRDLLLWLAHARHDHCESKCERISGGIYLPFHYESECENKSSDFYL